MRALKKMKSNDFIVAAVLLLISGLAFFALKHSGSSNESAALIVFVDGKEIDKIELLNDDSNDGIYCVSKIGDSFDCKRVDDADYKNLHCENAFEIKNRTAKMISATCQDGLCTRMNAVSKDGEMIICLPHKLYLKVISNTAKQDLDAVSD